MTATGEVIAGELDSADDATVLSELHERGLLPIQASRVAVDAMVQPRRGFLRSGRSLPAADLAMLMQQLARLLKSSLPLERALEILTGLVGRGRVQKVMGETLAAVRDGATLAEAMARQGRAFPTEMVSMVRAGEGGSALQSVLARLAEFLVRSEAIRQKVVSALIYPAILTVVAAVSVVIVLTLVLPQFEPMFRDAGAKLPASTRLIMEIGDLLRDYWWALLLAFCGVAIAGERMLRLPRIAYARDRLLLFLPVIGDLIRKFEIGRFTRTLGVLLANGVPGPRGLELCGNIIGNRVLAAAARTAAQHFTEGEGLSVPLARTGEFPPLCIHLVRIGEETGKLEDMLGEIAEVYDQDVQRLLDRLLALLVPGITIIMGVMIAGIIASVMTAMMSINDLVL